jgi:signal transduction histidine kinase
MWRRFQPPLVLVSLALVGLIAVLAVLQYRWLGQISDAQRTERRATLANGASEFAQDFDREINRAFLMFQGEPRTITEPPTQVSVDEEAAHLAQQYASRYDQWQASARYPRLLQDVYSVSLTENGDATIRKFDPVRRTLEPADWPQSMAGWREHLAATAKREGAPEAGAFFVRRIPNAIWEEVPAIVVPAPFLFVTKTATFDRSGQRQNVTATFQHSLGMPASIGYTLLTLDRDYIAREVLPALASRHFSQHRDASVTNGPLDYKVAVVSRAGPVFQSSPAFTPAFDARADATADLLQVRTQDFTALVSEVRRLTSLGSTFFATPERAGARLGSGDGRPLSIVIQQSAATSTGRAGTAARLTTTGSTPLWKVIVAHPSGSLETAVNAARRRNLVVSFSILGILGVSMGLLILSTRRAQRLAKQQMEFVATVSHELRTPLAVIRSAAENLADGVVHDENRIRRYGEVMRSEGRRLTEMVEQILEFAGIQSGQRGFVLRPIAIAPLVHDILSSSSSIIESAGLAVDVDLPDTLVPVLGDEPALRRVFQNLIDNAVKYGASGGRIRVSARRDGNTVLVTVADRGIGIDAADHDKIFEPFYRAPDVVAAQMQGAGLGLSLVRRIVSAHGGRVTVKSAPRDGSEFTVQLPIATDHPAAKTVDATTTAESPRNVEAPRYS